MQIARTLFAIVSPCLVLSPAGAQSSPLTARQVVERIQKHVGVAWRSDTVDTFKAGDPDTPVSGIATTMMATFDVLVRASASGANLIITHEPTFFGHLDKIGDLEQEGDAVFAAKKAFIEKNHLVVWRFHDHWHARRPDGIQTGMIRALGWEKYQNPDNNHLFVIPEMSLQALASAVRDSLGIRTLRVVGDPTMRVTKVGLAPGAPGFVPQRRMLQSDSVEVLLMGEGTEWEPIEYGADAVAEGKRKALIVLGHIPSEQAGMEDCAGWLKTFVTEVPVRFVPAVEPFWSPR